MNIQQLLASKELIIVIKVSWCDQVNTSRTVHAATTTFQIIHQPRNGRSSIHGIHSVHML